MARIVMLIVLVSLAVGSMGKDKKDSGGAGDQFVKGLKQDNSAGSASGQFTNGLKQERAVSSAGRQFSQDLESKTKDGVGSDASGKFTEGLKSKGNSKEQRDYREESLERARQSRENQDGQAPQAEERSRNSNNSGNSSRERPAEVQEDSGGQIECNFDPIVQLRRQARNGDSDAQYRLGNIYSMGDCVKKDKREAIKWYRKASEQGEGRSIRALEQMGEKP